MSLNLKTNNYVTFDYKMTTCVSLTYYILILCIDEFRIYIPQKHKKFMLMLI